jgi:tetratricopeptide (TPR) repeat protein
VGFTALAEDRDPEETRELLSRYFELAREVIGRYGGTVEKFIGDAVMAVWGAPTALEDDAELAVRAALELVDAVPTLAPDLQARAGVLTGEAAVTIGALGEGMVAGDLVNTASRLQSVAEAGTVLVGEATERAAAKAIAFDVVTEQTLKGKQAPVKAYRAVRVVAELGGTGRSEMLEAPFVGRLEELRLLKDLFHSTGREKRTRLVSVIGPAGIGKSRLAWEFLKYVDGLVDTIWWHAGRSPAYGVGISFWALGEMVRARCGLLETDDQVTTRTKVGAAVDEWLTDEDERRWIEGALLSLLGVGDPLPGGRDEMFAAWRTFFERIAERGTVVMLFEDLHWADAGLLDFIDHIMEWARALPIYVVTLARPELLEKRPDWGAGKRNFTSVSLDPLTAAEMRELLNGMAPDLPAPALNAIVQRADGIPLYAVETIRMLVADGKLIESEGVYRPVGDISTLAVPETLTALIAARLDGLEKGDRDLLQHGAVLGQSFTVDALAGLTGMEPDQLEPRLRAMTKREVLRFDAHPRSPERGQYAFVQSLIREVAYNTLAKPDRRIRHLAAARYFEGLGGDELAGALARHYLAAYENSPAGPEADALAAQARIALRGAGERAVALGSHEQAAAYFDQAIEVTTDPSEQADLLIKAGDSLVAINFFAEADRRLERAVELRRQQGDATALATAITALARSYLPAGHPSRAIALLESAQVELEAVSENPAGIALRSQLARAYMLNADGERAIPACDRVLADAERANLVDIVADTLITRGSALIQGFRSREGIGAIRAGTELAEQEGLQLTALRGLNNLAGLGSDFDPATTLDVVARAMPLATRLGQRSLTATLELSAASARFLQGDWQTALRDLQSALAIESDDQQRAVLMAQAIWIQSAMGEEVDAQVNEAVAYLRSSGERMQETQVHDLLAITEFNRGNLGAARREALESNAMEDYPTIVHYALRASLWSGDLEAARADLATLKALGSHGPFPDVQEKVLTAGVLALEGNKRDALRLYQEGRRTMRDGGLRFPLALTAIDMAILLPGEAATHEAVAEGRGILTDLGAKPFLERLEASADEQEGRSNSTARSRSEVPAG